MTHRALPLSPTGTGTGWVMGMAPGMGQPGLLHIHVHAEPQNMTLFGSQVFAGVTG